MHHRTMFSVMMFLLSRCFHACNTIEKEEKKTNEHKRAVEGIRVNIFFLRSFFFFSFFSFSFSSLLLLLEALQLMVTFLLYPFRETPEKLNSLLLYYFLRNMTECIFRATHTHSCIRAYIDQMVPTRKREREKKKR